MIDMPWRPNTCVPYAGVMIHSVEEQGRRFWAFRRDDPWALRQEFSSLRDACEALDFQERANG